MVVGVLVTKVYKVGVQWQQNLRSEVSKVVGHDRDKRMRTMRIARNKVEVICSKPYYFSNKAKQA